MRTKKSLPAVARRLKPRKVREQEFVDSFDAAAEEEFDAVFAAEDMPFYEVCHQMERERSLGRDERCD